jgi:serine/threonine-protein kinase
MCPPNETLPDPVGSPSQVLAGIVERFEDAWQQGPPPDLDAFLPIAGELRRRALVELAPIDLGHRLKAGDRARVEDYLGRYPELAGDDAAVLDLIVAEHRLRQRHEADLDTAEYLRRFPQHHEALRARLPSTGEVPSTINTSPPSVDDIPETRPPSPPDPSTPDAGGLTLPLAGRRYHLFDEIGKGGMGAVLRARDPYLGRDLAIKVMHGDGHDKPDLLRRFVEEAQVGGQLQHPGIVPVHDVGQLEDGRPFIAMKLVKGRTLAALLQERADPAQDLPTFVDIFGQVCQTLAYAHSKGILHRDLKPANIMVGAFGEVQVMDWGLAKVLRPPSTTKEAAPTVPAGTVIRTLRSDAEGAESHAGAVMGTPAYMAPEQARGQVETLDERCDVFGLGSILCEILTGQPPYTGRSVNEIHGRAMGADLTETWRRLDACGADADLLRLARACLAAEKEARPRDAGAVAEAVTASLHSVQARLRQAELERARAEVQAREERRRWRLTALLAAAVLALVLLGGGVVVWQQRQQAHREADVEAALAQLAGFQDHGRWAEARTVLEQAERHLGDSGPAELRRRLGQARADLELVQRFEAARLRATTVIAGHFDKKGAEEEYAAALRDSGLGEPGEDTAAVAERVRASSVRRQVAEALHDWAARAEDRGLRDWLLAVARQADPDPWRDRLREPATWSDRQALERLARQADIANQPAQTLTDLARVLRAREGDVVPLLRAAQLRHPQDFWVHFDLGYALQKAQRWDEAIGCYRAALSLRPETTVVLNNLGVALYDKGLLDEAIGHFQQALQLDRRDPKAHTNLGNALKAKGRLEEAIGHYQQALQVNPQEADAHNNLGLALYTKGHLDEAIGHYQQALQIDPKFADAHSNLGAALADKGLLDEAIDHDQQALRLDPKDTVAHTNLGTALYRKGRPEEAIGHYQQALQINPKLAGAHNALGVALKAKGRLDEAIGHYQQALQIDPKYAPAHSNLGSALQAKGRLDEAIGHYQQALQIDPKNPGAHCNLGLALQARGDFAQALSALKRGHELGSRRPDWRYPSLQWVQRCERLLALEARLPAVLQGKDQPANAAEQLSFADFCTLKKRYGDAVRFYAAAFTAQPKLADDLQAQPRYNAACCAARAATQEPAVTLDDKERGRLRQQALDWLRADLTAWAKTSARARVQATLTHWQQDPDLASVRDKDALTKLPQAEAQAWQKLWADVADLLRRSP